MADDEEAFLYGDVGGDDSNNAANLPEGSQEEDTTGFPEESQDGMANQEKAEEPDETGDQPGDQGKEKQQKGEDDEEDEDEEDEDSDDEDGVQITIDQNKIDEAKTSYQSFGLNKSVRQLPGEKKGKFAVEEFDQIGLINGTDAVEFDMESLEDKPWKKPGADITDYFNYGFTEETWNAYCNRQRKLRVNESGVGLPGTMNSVILSKPPPINVLGAGGNTIPSVGAQQNVPKKLPTVLNRVAPQAADAVPTVSVPEEPPPPAPIAVMTSDKREYSKKVIETMDFSVPPPGIPPPGLPPTSMPPPNFDAPPPMEFPADDPFGQKEYDYGYSSYEPTMESQWSAPPPQHQGGDAPPGDAGYEERERDVWRERSNGRRSSRDDRDLRERDPRESSSRDTRGPREGSSSSSRYAERDKGDRDRVDRDRGGDRDRDRKRRRTRSRSRDRYRDHRERERDRDRDRDRDRESSSRKSERESRRSDRRERTSKSRSPGGSSRHKKSKREKKDREIKTEIKQEREDEVDQ